MNNEYKWEDIGSETSRLKVPGGFLYKYYNCNIVFVPDINEIVQNVLAAIHNSEYLGAIQHLLNG